MAPPQVKRWCFTLNNWTEEELTNIRIKTQDQTKYLIAGKEKGEEGTPHLQGFVHFKNKKRMSEVKKIIGPRAHLEVAVGSDIDNKEYCGKEGDVAIEEGEPQENGSKKRKTTMGKKIRDLVHKLSNEKRVAVLEDPDNVQTYALYRSTIDKLVREEKLEFEIVMMKDEFATVQLREWQVNLIKIIDGPIDNRQVHWYTDQEGGKGKTFMSRYLVSQGNAIRFENGKSADIKFAYGGQRVAIFDYCRAQSEHINYEVIESIKNGIYLNTKYESEMRIYSIPHVVVFANRPPDWGKMSIDRWMHHII